MKYSKKVSISYTLKSLNESEGYKGIIRHWSSNYDYFAYYTNTFPEPKTYIPTREIIEKSIDKLLTGEIKNIRWRDMS